MDVILALKAVLVGIIWGGSYLILFALCVHLFPLPQYYRLRAYFAQRSAELIRNDMAERTVRSFLEKMDKGLSKWLRSVKVLRFLVVLLLLLGVGLYTWSLNAVLKQQLPLAGLQDFGFYYWLALPLPLLFLIWQAWRLYNRTTRSLS